MGYPDDFNTLAFERRYGGVSENSARRADELRASIGRLERRMSVSNQIYDRLDQRHSEAVRELAELEN